MLDERLRRRLEDLNRGPLPSSASSVKRPSAAAKNPSPMPSQAKPSSNGSPLRPGAVPPLPGLLRRAQVVKNEAGEHLRIPVALEELWPGGERLVGKRQTHLQSQNVSIQLTVDQAEKRALVDAFPHNLLLLDLETCGLAGSALFLIGVLRWMEEGLKIELLLARNYAEEKALLVSFWRLVEADTLLVTFNGKSFDWPMVADRSARYLLFRGFQPPRPQHVDLLHHARRRWRRQLPDCKLQTLERYICGRGRTGDIPGGQIPAAYQEYVHTGADREMNAILHHNAVDLVTLLDLAVRLAR